MEPNNNEIEHDNVEQVIDENSRRGRPRIRRTFEEEREFRERQRVLKNERVRRHRARCDNNVNNNEGARERSEGKDLSNVKKA